MAHIDQTKKTPSVDLEKLKGKKIKLKRDEEEGIVEFDAWDFHRLQGFIITQLVSSINTMGLTFDQAIQNVLNEVPATETDSKEETPVYEPVPTETTDESTPEPKEEAKK